MAGLTLEELEGFQTGRTMSDKDARQSGRTMSDKDLLMEELRRLQEGRTLSDRDIMEALSYLEGSAPEVPQSGRALSDRDMVPMLQGGGQTVPPVPPVPPVPAAVPAVGGGLPSVADNMRNAMPPAKSSPSVPPAQNTQQMAGMPSMTPEVEQAIAQTIEVSETPEEILTNAMASTVVSVAESPEEIISTFETAKEQALMQYAQITGSPDAGMSETDARLMELLGGGDEMMMSEEVMI